MDPRELLRRVHESGNPLIDGRTVTIVWEGQQAPALISDRTDWDEHPQALTRLSAGVWAASFDLPRDAYLEYSFFDIATGKRVADPLNSRRLPDGLGHVNHWFYMPGAAPSLWTERRRGVPRGTITRHVLPVTWTGVGRRRAVHLYRPAAGGRVPLLVVYDGREYRTGGRLPIVLDNLIAAGRIPPLAAAFVDNGGPARMTEYACADTSLGMLLYQVLPLAGEHLDLLDIKRHPGAYGVLGASMGGLMALYTGLRLPQVFGRVFSQSGAFWLGDGEPAGPPFATAVVDLVRAVPRPDLRIYMDVGKFEWLLPANRRMRKALLANGFAPSYREYAGAHNFTCWRNDLAAGLEFLFG